MIDKDPRMCPKCGSRSAVYGSPLPGRRRACLNKECGFRWRTVEVPEEDFYTMWVWYRDFKAQRGDRFEEMMEKMGSLWAMAYDLGEFFGFHVVGQGGTNGDDEREGAGTAGG